MANNNTDEPVYHVRDKYGVRKYLRSTDEPAQKWRQTEKIKKEEEELEQLRLEEWFEGDEIKPKKQDLINALKKIEKIGISSNTSGVESIIDRNDMNDEEIASYITAMQNQEQPEAYQQEPDLDSLLGRSYAPSEEFREWSQGGSSIPEIAEAKMRGRERTKAMLALMRWNAEQSANLHNQDILPLHMMAQRNIDPRDYGAAPPPNAPQIPMQSQDRGWESVMEDMGRWQDQLSQRKRDRRYDFDLEKWIDPPPPQLTGRSRFGDRIAF